MKKPFAESCEQNKDVILDVLKPLCSDAEKLLEIGSGTGQHAIYFAENMAHLSWQTSDLKENHAGINLWLEEKNLPNINPPIEIDVRQNDWAVTDIDIIFTANTLHIMPWEAVKPMMIHAGKILKPQGRLIIYGPFNYNNQYTSESNARFDIWLKQNSSPLSAIRHFEAVNELAEQADMKLYQDFEMPANNRILCFQKK